MELRETVAAGGLPISMISSIPSELSLLDTLLGPAVTCAGIVAIEAWEGRAAGSGVALVEVGVTSAVVRDKVTHGRLLIGGGGVLWSNSALEYLWWNFLPFSFPFPYLTQFAAVLFVDTYRLYIEWWHMYE